MSKILLVFCCLVCLHAHAGKQAFDQENGAIQYNLTDTIIEDPGKGDEAIDEIIKTRSAPRKENVQYFDRVARYGFKDLFSNYSYNTAVPYNAQVNPNAAFFVRDYIKAHGTYLQDMRSWGQPYFNLIEGILRQYGLPRELKYIAVIESNLRSGATSPVGAGGPWQFMPYTARDYGLVVNGYLDERRDYYKSTHAAARYLLVLYRQMHDWLLVMAAYNGGPGRVYDAIKRSGSRNFWDLQYYLPAESRTYVKRFIATHLIMEGNGSLTNPGGALMPMDQYAGMMNGNPPAIDLTGKKSAYDKTQEPSVAEQTDVEVFSISGKYNSMVIVKNLAMDIALFNHYNPDFDGVLAATGKFDLRLPPEKMQVFIANRYPILNECVQLLLSGASFPENKMVSPATRQKK